jgi:effector-binding domain-containing protein
MGYQIETKEMQSQPIVSIRATTDEAGLGKFFETTYPVLTSSIQSEGLQPTGPPFARYFKFSKEEVDVEGGVPVSGSPKGGGDVNAGEIPGGRVASTMHVGPYDKLGDAYAAIETFMKENGLEAAGPPMEIYWSDPQEEKDTSKLQTEIVWPIK